MVRQLHDGNLSKGEMPSGVEERKRISNDSACYIRAVVRYELNG